MTEKLISARKSISNFLVPYPTILITQNTSGVYNAITMSYLSAIHWNPPSIVLSVGSESKTSMNLEENPNFTVCVLTNSQRSQEIAKTVGTISGKDDNKSKELEKKFLTQGQFKDEWPPIIEGTIMALFNSVVKRIEYNGQILYIAEIKGSSLSESLHMLDDFNNNKMWSALEESALTHAQIYNEIE